MDFGELSSVRSSRQKCERRSVLSSFQKREWRSPSSSRVQFTVQFMSQFITYPRFHTKVESTRCDDSLEKVYSHNKNAKQNVQRKCMRRLYECTIFVMYESHLEQILSHRNQQVQIATLYWSAMNNDSLGIFQFQGPQSIRRAKSADVNSVLT